MSTPYEKYQFYKRTKIERILELLIKEHRIGQDDLLQEFIKDALLDDIIATKRFDVIIEFITFMDSSIFLYQSIHQPLSRIEDVFVCHHIALILSQTPELIPVFVQNDKFPILEILLGHVHLDGEKGEMARVAFELLVKIHHCDVESFLKQSDFVGVVISSLCGLYCSLSMDLKSFISYYEFIQSLVTFSKELLDQFQSLFLGKVVASTLNDSSDFDGSTNNWFYITLTMLEHTRNEKMIEIFITTLFSDTETNGSDLTTRDILFSKLTSLSETVCISILTLLANVVKKWDGSVALLFGIRNSGGILDVSEHVHVLERMMAICGKDVDGMDSYVTDAVLAMEHISHRISTVSLDQPEADDELEQFESTLWNKLYDKLNLFYSQSVNVNLALTLLIKNITVEPNTNLYRILFTSEKDIVQVLERLHGEIAKDSKTRMRMDLVKKEMERDLNSKDKDRELIKNYVVLEEFVKEMVGCLMMRGSSCREHISFL